uniref:Uncharacterized protein n=1 Tax=Timema bartmani TaxID=61472 RepID=A0A7R9F9Q1_9NEOP|nr:unnamed protein product [Timema bartmani]
MKRMTLNMMMWKEFLQPLHLKDLRNTQLHGVTTEESKGSVHKKFVQPLIEQLGVPRKILLLHFLQRFQDVPPILGALHELHSTQDRNIVGVDGSIRKP